MTDFLQTVFLLCSLGFHAAVTEEIIYAQVGEDVSLNLSYESNKYLFWNFGDGQIAWHNPSGGKGTTAGWGPRLKFPDKSPNSLMIRNLTQSDFGIFSCSVKDKMKVEIAKFNFKLIQLNVAVEPPVLLPGETLSLTCGVRGQENVPQIQWLNPQGQKEGSGGRANVQVSSLHSGQWTCVVTRAGKETRVNRKVTVIDLLPLAPTSTQFTSASTPLAIPCSLAPGATWDHVKSKDVHEVGWNFCPPNPHCNKSSLFTLSVVDSKPTWKKPADRALRPSPKPSSGDLSLGRNLAREEDGGDYECFVKFRNGVTLNRTVRVEVLRIIASPKTQLTTGQELNLTCTTGHPLPPDVQIKWIPPSEASSSPSSSSSTPPPSLPSSAQDTGSPLLTVKAVGRSHNGTWRCELRRGETALTSAAVVLNIESKFSAWMLVTLCAAVAILILLVILIVILQRRRQRRPRRHMRLCNCKNPKPKGFYRS